jgi:hypothetical protein
MAKTEAERKTSKSRSGAAWTEGEKALLVARFDQGISLRELCDEHERSGNAIVSQLAHMERIRVEGNGYVRTGPMFATFQELKTH